MTTVNSDIFSTHTCIFVLSVWPLTLIRAPVIWFRLSDESSAESRLSLAAVSTGTSVRPTSTMSPHDAGKETLLLSLILLTPAHFMPTASGLHVLAICTLVATCGQLNCNDGYEMLRGQWTYIWLADEPVHIPFFVWNDWLLYRCLNTPILTSPSHSNLLICILSPPDVPTII